MIPLLWFGRAGEGKKRVEDDAQTEVKGGEARSVDVEPNPGTSELVAHEPSIEAKQHIGDTRIDKPNHEQRDLRTSALLASTREVGDLGPRIAIHLWVTGIVQGVGFRKWTERNAKELELSGWARNLEDGRVEILLEGPQRRIEEFEERCKRGPRRAMVTNIEKRDEPVRDADSFRLRKTPGAVAAAKD